MKARESPNPTFRDLASMLAAEPKLWVKIEPEGAFYWAELWRDEEKLHCAKARDPETALAKLITYAEEIWCAHEEETYAARHRY